MRPALALLAAVTLLAGCAVANPRPVYQTTTTATDGSPTLVVGVERDDANAYTARTLAHELAFGLSQRGRPAIDLPAFVHEAVHRGIVVPDAVTTGLRAGVADADTLAWLRAERISGLIVLDVAIYEQVWGSKGKRTRVGLTARGRRLTGDEETWRAYTTPDVEDEPGQGFQIATEAALGALVRVIVGEREPLALPTPQQVVPHLRLRW
jgi:hypothetical protein